MNSFSSRNLTQAWMAAECPDSGVVDSASDANSSVQEA